MQNETTMKNTRFTPTEAIESLTTTEDLLDLLRNSRGFESRFFQGEVLSITSISTEKITYRYPTRKTGWFKPLRMIEELKSGDIKLN